MTTLMQLRVAGAKWMIYNMYKIVMFKYQDKF